MTQSPCSIVVAEDHPVMLRGLVDVLRACPMLDVVEACPDGKSALEAIRKLSPDVAVLDITMPGADRIEIRWRSRQAPCKYPELGGTDRSHQ